jgi:hypothetical protein
MFSVDPTKGEIGTAIADYVGAIHPDDIGRVWASVEKSIATGANRHCCINLGSVARGG